MGLFEKNKQNDYSIEESYKDELIKRLKEEIENLKSQLKFEEQITEGFVLTSGEYIVGIDLKPGRYSLKLTYGNDGRLETTGRNWVIETLGDRWNGITEYKNLSLKSGQKLKLSGNIKVLLKEEKPINVNENISIIQQKEEEIEKLKKQLREYKKTIEELKFSANEKYFEEKYIWKYGYYYGGETIGVGIYDIRVISGKGYIKERGNYHEMGDLPNGKKELKGLKVNNKTKIEITDSLEVEAIKKGVKIL